LNESEFYAIIYATEKNKAPPGAQKEGKKNEKIG
jgi:hypothetical protein